MINDGFQWLNVFPKKLHLRCLTGFWIHLWIMRVRTNNENFKNMIFVGKYSWESCIHLKFVFEWNFKSVENWKCFSYSMFVFIRNFLKWSNYSITQFLLTRSDFFVTKKFEIEAWTEILNSRIFVRGTLMIIHFDGINYYQSEGIVYDKQDVSHSVNKTRYT